jgi:hypothetical protein
MATTVETVEADVQEREIDVATIEPIEPTGNSLDSAAQGPIKRARSNSPNETDGDVDADVTNQSKKRRKSPSPPRRSSISGQGDFETLQEKIDHAKKELALEQDAQQFAAREEMVRAKAQLLEREDPRTEDIQRRLQEEAQLHMERARVRMAQLGNDAGSEKEAKEVKELPGSPRNGKKSFLENLNPLPPVPTPIDSGRRTSAPNSYSPMQMHMGLMRSTPGAYQPAPGYFQLHMPVTTRGSPPIVAQSSPNGLITAQYSMPNPNPNPNQGSKSPSHVATTMASAPQPQPIQIPPGMMAALPSPPGLNLPYSSAHPSTHPSPRPVQVYHVRPTQSGMPPQPMAPAQPAMAPGIQQMPQPGMPQPTMPPQGMSQSGMPQQGMRQGMYPPYNQYSYGMPYGQPSRPPYPGYYPMHGQTGQMQAGPMQAGQMPPGQMQAGPMQAGQMPPGQMPPGQMQAGPMQAGQMPPGQMQAGPMQAGQMPPGQMQAGPMQAGQMQPGQMPYGYGQMWQSQPPPGGPNFSMRMPAQREAQAYSRGLPPSPQIPQASGIGGAGFSLASLAEAAQAAQAADQPSSKKSTSANDLLNSLFSKANALTDVDRDVIVDFVRGKSGVYPPNLLTFVAQTSGTVKILIDEEIVTDPSTGDAYREYVEFEIDYSTKQWRKVKKRKRVA